jgi:hypothetical protein
MKLKRVGFFRELEHGDPAGPEIRDCVRDRPQADEASIATYLRNGVLLICCPGVVGDILDSNAGPIGSPDILTDGVWAWPGDLCYYLQKYHVRLPDEFVAHLRLKSFRPPSDREVDVAKLEL